MGKKLDSVKDFFFGGTAQAGVDIAGGVSDIVERWLPGEAKKHEISMEVSKLIESSVANARENDKPMDSGVRWVDAFVNGINRLIRPWVTITVLGSLFGYWELPPPDSIDPHYWLMAQIVLTFWFGGRAVFKDLPAAIKSFAKLKKLRES